MTGGDEQQETLTANFCLSLRRLPRVRHVCAGAVAVRAGGLQGIEYNSVEQNRFQIGLRALTVRVGFWGGLVYSRKLEGRLWNHIDNYSGFCTAGIVPLIDSKPKPQAAPPKLASLLILVPGQDEDRSDVRPTISVPRRSWSCGSRHNIAIDSRILRLLSSKVKIQWQGFFFNATYVQGLSTFMSLVKMNMKISEQTYTYVQPRSLPDNFLTVVPDVLEPK